MTRHRSELSTYSVVAELTAPNYWLILQYLDSAEAQGLIRG